MLKEFFYLQKSDRKVLLLLLSIAAVAFLVIQLTDAEQPEEETTAMEQDTLKTPLTEKPAPAYYQTTERKVERFTFDPNTADSTQLLRLGLQPWQVRNIYKYRAAGGIYRKKEDFAKLYGLTVKEYRELEPYISISNDYLPASTLIKEQRPERDTLHHPVKLAEGKTLDLATADTTTLRQVPGIGSYWARRIADYGKRLGGYVNTGQLLEIEGFPTEALPYFTISATSTQRLNINQLSLNELKQHPYMNYYQAKAIVDYRRKHGRIADLDELRLLPDFSSEAICRLRPYITY